MRGKVQMVFVALGCNRITPACAGKSILVIAWVQYCRDHPRMCGEKNIVRKASFDPQGSPPHVRGKAFTHTLYHSIVGITPACAGKRPQVVQAFRLLQDHHRMCGEKGQRPPLRQQEAGSPPHVRGKVGCLLFRVTPNGITPACAGKRKRKPWTCRSRRDHPRMCGEKTKKIP